jgi:hypothetical protein
MNFADAARKGLNANERAVAARQEMDAVLHEASKQLTEALGGELTLRFAGSIPAMVEAKRRGRDVPLTGILEVVGKSDRYKYLAEVGLGELGYPVWLIWGNERGYATNRTEFEVALSKLLESRVTGERIDWVLTGSGSEPSGA